MTALFSAIFFFSGASALIFETLWFHQASLGFGNSIWATSLVLSGFMAGLALGNAWAAGKGDRLGDPIRIYAAAETVIGLTGVGLVYLLPELGSLLAPMARPFLDHPYILNPLRLVSAFALLVIPSTAMGITLPLLARALCHYEPNFGRVLGRLYGWNTLGAVIGALLPEVYLIGSLGLRGTALAAGGINLLAAAAALALSYRMPPRTAPDAPAPRTGGRMPGAVWLVCGFLSGFSLLALEVVWFRFLLLFVVGQAESFAVMLGIVLAGIGLGGLFAARLLHRRPGAHSAAPMVAFLAGTLCVAGYAAFPWIIAPFAKQSIRELGVIMIIGLPLMLPVSFLSGIFFTLIGAAFRAEARSDSAAAGALTFANTTGAALGSLAGGFLLLPFLGMERSFFLIALLYGGIGLLSAYKSPLPRKVAALGLAVSLTSLALFPFKAMVEKFIPIPAGRHMKPGQGEIVAVREGQLETILYLERRWMDRPLYHRMVTNSFSMSSTYEAARRYMRLFVYWPIAVHPEIRNALLISYGVGVTAKALTETPTIEHIDMVDISRDVLEMNRVVYPNPADLPYNDPRVRVHIEDGRYFLQTTEKRYDLITGEPPPPNIAGVVNLYTTEYFRLLRDRLAEGGIVTYWLPLHDLSDISAKAVIRAFCEAFEDCSLWNGEGTDLLMIGTRNARGEATEESFARQWNDPILLPEMRKLGFERPEQLGALFIGGPDYLRDLAASETPLQDDNPKRITAPFGPQDAVARVYESIRDVKAARERFSKSPMVQTLFPERWRDGALA
ncbi:MAG TPA: fused MFS/spermidine synthase, partial [Nitrospiria bacterium]